MEHMFSKKELQKMIIPLLLEQLLILVVGMADTFMVSHAGEDAVSGVSLVNNFNTIFIYIFTAPCFRWCSYHLSVLRKERQRKSQQSCFSVTYILCSCFSCHSDYRASFQTSDDVIDVR